LKEGGKKERLLSFASRINGKKKIERRRGEEGETHSFVLALPIDQRKKGVRKEKKKGGRRQKKSPLHNALLEFLI